MKMLRPRINDNPHCIVITCLPLVVTYPEHIDLSPLYRVTARSGSDTDLQPGSRIPFAKLHFRSNWDRDSFITTRASDSSHGFERCTTMHNPDTPNYLTGYFYPIMGTIAQSSLVPTHSVHQISSLSLIVSVSVQLGNIAGTILVAGHEVIPRYLCSSYAARISPHTSPSRKDTNSDSDSMDIP